MSDLVLGDLHKKYEELVGMAFQGEYEGEFTMPQTGNPREVWSIGQGDPFAAILGGISKSVLKAYGKTVWKGITGPEDSNNFTDYWLWVEPGFSEELPERRSYNFKNCTMHAIHMRWCWFLVWRQHRSKQTAPVINSLNKEYTKYVGSCTMSI